MKIESKSIDLSAVPIEPYYSEGGIAIYNCDCRKIIPFLPRVCLLLTDPPYGINYDPTRYKTATCKTKVVGDETEFNPWQLIDIRADYKIVWGGNNFANRLPIGGWLCWDKRCTEQADKVIGSPIELAWVSKETTYKIKRLQHTGAKNADGEGVKRVHPTQKPIKLMQWCIGLFPTSQRILDPFMGSGTTLVAAKVEGRQCVGIEQEESFCEIAANRLSQ